MLKHRMYLGALSLLLVNTTAIIAEGTPQAERRTLHIGQPLEPTSANFLKQTGVWNTVVYHDLNELLVRFNQVRNRIEPGQAKAWRYDASQGEYWFTLREGLKWSDGTPIRAQDYVRSWRYYASAEDSSPCSNVLSAVKHFDDIKANRLPAKRLGVHALDDLSLRVKLEQSSQRFLQFLSDSDCFLLPFHRKEHLDFSADWTDSQAIAYNGPYRLHSDIVSGKPVVLTRNPHYWNKKDLYFKKIVWHAYAQRNTELVKDLLEGRLHIAYYMSGNSNVPWMKAYRPDWVKYYPSGNLEYLTIHRSRAPLAQSPQLRQVLSMSIVRQALVGKLRNRQKGSPTFSLAPLHYYHQPPPEPDWWHWSKHQRREKARSILAALGYGPSKPLTVSLRMNLEQNRVRVAENLAAMWGAVGIQTELQFNEVGPHYQAIDQGDFEIARASWMDATGSPRYFFRLLDPSSNLDPHSIKLAEWPEALNDDSLTEEQEEKLYHEIEAENQRTASIIPLYHLDEVSFVNPKLQGYQGGKWWLRDLTAMRWRGEIAQ